MDKNKFNFYQVFTREKSFIYNSVNYYVKIPPRFLVGPAIFRDVSRKILEDFKPGIKYIRLGISLKEYRNPLLENTCIFSWILIEYTCIFNRK